MDAHFDSTQFHPTFTGWGSHSPFEVSMDSFLHKVHEYGLPDDVVAQAATSAWDFFDMVHAPIEIGSVTGVETGNPYTYEDDKLIVSPFQLKALGIHDQNSLSLICTHEAVHQITQNIYAHGQISDWQSELISDKWMGIRAAIDGYDLKNVLESLSDSIDSSSHPGYDLRLRHIQEGYDLVETLQEKDIPLTFDNLMNRAVDQIVSDKDILVREQLAKTHDSTMDTAQSTFRGYTKSEIDSHIREEQRKIDNAKSVIAEHSRAMANKAAAGQAFDSDKYAVGSAKVDLENALKAKSSWENTKPTKQ